MFNDDQVKFVTSKNKKIAKWCYVLWTQNSQQFLFFGHRLDLTNAIRAAGSTEGLGPFPVLRHRHLEPHTNQITGKQGYKFQKLGQIDGNIS